MLAPAPRCAALRPGLRGLEGVAMVAVRGAVGCAVAALLLGHGLSTMDPSRRAALWGAARAALGAAPPVTAVQPARPAPVPAPRSAPPAAAAASAVPPPTAAFDEEAIPGDRYGQFHTDVVIDGLRVRAMVDTGASFVGLSADDADRLGIYPLASDFRYAVQTANGRTLVAQVRLASVRLGDIEVRDVPALVSARGQLGETLLGMSFLSRLSGMRVDRGRLLLRR